jgi:hypothetical protein
MMGNLFVLIYCLLCEFGSYSSFYHRRPHSGAGTLIIHPARLSKRASSSFPSFFA